MNSAEAGGRATSETAVAEILRIRQVSRLSMQFIRERYDVLCLRQGFLTIIGGRIHRALNTYSLLANQVRHPDTANFLSDMSQSFIELKTLYNDLTDLINLPVTEFTQAFILTAWLQPSRELIDAIKTVLVSKKASVRWLLDEALIRLRETLDQQSTQLHLSSRSAIMPEDSMTRLEPYQLH